MRRRERGLSLVELLITLGLTVTMGFLAATLFKPDTKASWGRVADDYVKHLMALKEKYKREEGAYPLAQNATRITTATEFSGSGLTLTPIFLNEISAKVYSTSTGASSCHLDYPTGVALYAMCYDGTGIWTAGVLSMSELPASPGVQNTWVLLDMNGTTGPNSLSSTGDRVILYIAPNDAYTGYTDRILTRRQYALEYCPSNCTGHEKDVSFYDKYKGYDSLGDNSGTGSTSTSSGSTTGYTTGL